MSDFLRRNPQLRPLGRPGQRDVSLRARPGRHLRRRGPGDQGQGTLGGTKTYASNILYAPQGAVQSLPLGNGITETWSFSTLRQQPTSLTAGSALALGFYYCPNQQPSCTTNNGNILGADDREQRRSERFPSFRV